MSDMFQITAPAPDEDGPVGYIVGGSLKDNLRARLTVSPQDVQEGSFVTVDSGIWRFYGLVTDLQLGATDPRFADEQSEKRLPRGLAGLLHGQTLYTNLEIMPALMLEIGPPLGDPGYMAWRSEHIDDPKPIPIKTVPSHHAPVRRASAGDVAEIFGKPGEKGNFTIGHTREQNLPVCIDLDKFVQRSAGIFGATGTGKSFLTRILLSGLIQRDKASVLIFDMHNEYGPDDTSSDTNQRVPGLKSKFHSKVQLVGLGSDSSIRGSTPDFHLEIAEQDITPADIEMLTRELNLRETTPTTLNALWNCFHSQWLRKFREMRPGATIEDENGKKIFAPNSVEYWANEYGVHPAAALGLYDKLRAIFNLSYVVEHPAADTLKEIIRSLEAGRNVVLSFGKHESDLDYLLVTNLLTRQIRQKWEELTNEFRSGRSKQEPRPLVIAVEEAHKLLNREIASQTAFSTIAREMRKYYVTLLIIDQRPSQIYDEVMSQLGTRISGWLGDDADISAVLSGLAGRDALRGMLSRLQPREEVLMLGWGVPMPIPVKSRRYDEKFWQELKGGDAVQADEAALLKSLGF